MAPTRMHCGLEYLVELISCFLIEGERSIFMYVFDIYETDLGNK